MTLITKQLLNGLGTLHPTSEQDSKIEIPINIPGSIFDALIESKKLDDPFYGINEQKSAWVYENEWEITHEFNINSNILENDIIHIKFYGIDTFGVIYLNEHKLGKVDNMHRTYEFSIKKYLHKGSNNFKIHFFSASKIATERYVEDNKRINSPSCSISGQSYTHKAQYSYGWDWGPILPDIGIWKDVELIAYNEGRILSSQILQELSSDYKNVDITVRIDHSFREKVMENLTFKGILTHIHPQVTDFKLIEEIKPKNINDNLTFSFQPQLWWIKELGTPHLYQLTIEIYLNEALIDTQSQNIGIRDLKLIRRKDEWGESFFFQLNGVSVFAKGANWIPIHSFIPRGKRFGLYESILKDALAANMNMIRVWGGGILEDDLFYDICDKLGLLVWQDFPFACQTIPSIRNIEDKPNQFYKNAKILVRQGIVRLRNRASLALWCGNNEIEGIFSEYGRNDKKKKDLFSAYVELFEDYIPKMLEKLDPSRAYWPSSPSSGGTNTYSPEFTSQDENYGDSHFWTVWHGGASFTAYRENFSRFQSEFGFESFPDIKTCYEFCPEDQFEFESPIMKNHQKNWAGNQKILDYMKKRFKIPDSFEKRVILSQITQAEAMEYGVEHWRRHRGTPGKERCMGALYWQLNDCWPVASWSSLDYSEKLASKYSIPGRWKALHYYAKRFNKPIIVSIEEGRQTTTFVGVNALNKEIKAILNWQIIDPSGKNLQESSKTIILPPCSSIVLDTIDVSDKFDYKHVEIIGKFVVDDETLHVSQKETKNTLKSKESTRDLSELPLVRDILKDFIGNNIELKIYFEKDGPNSVKKVSAFMSQEQYFEGKCLLDEDGLICIKKSISENNHDLYDKDCFMNML